MKTLHYNCVSGISGDMNLSALIDMGADETKLVSELRKLNLDDWCFSSAKAQKQGMHGFEYSISMDIPPMSVSFLKVPAKRVQGNKK